MWLYRMHYSLRAPSALLFRLTLTKKSIHLSLHMRFEVTASPKAAKKAMKRFGGAPHIFQIKYSTNMSGTVQLLEI